MMILIYSNFCHVLSEKIYFIICGSWFDYNGFLHASEKGVKTSTSSTTKPTAANNCNTSSFCNNYQNRRSTDFGECSTPEHPSGK